MHLLNVFFVSVAMETSKTYLISDQSEICHGEVIQSESGSDTPEDIAVEMNQMELSAMKGALCSAYFP